MNPSKGDERYVDALIAASILGKQPTELSDEEVEAMINSAPEVLPEDERIRQRMDALFAQMFGTTSNASAEPEIAQTYNHFTAMNRGNEGDAFDDNVSEELRRAREDALKKLKDEKSKGERGGDDAQSV